MLLKQQTHIMFEGPPGFCVVSSFLAVVCVCVCLWKSLPNLTLNLVTQIYLPGLPS